MKSLLSVVQIFCSLFLITAILVQTRGGGLSSFFATSLQYHTKRGVEKILFYLTICLVIAFACISLLGVVLGGR